MSDDELVQVPRAEWEALKEAVAQLQQGGVARPAGLASTPEPHPEPDGDGRTDRRGLLKHGAILAAAAAAGGTALVAAQASPASATITAMQYGTHQDAGSDATILSSSAIFTLVAINNGSGIGLYATDNEAGTGVPLESQVQTATSTSPALVLLNFGLGSALQATVSNAANAATAISATTNGAGNAVSGQITNASSTANAVYGSTSGLGPAVVGQITNASSSAVAVGGVTNGTGAAFGGLSVGTGPAVEGSAWGTGPAVVAQVVSASNSQPAVSATTAGAGAAVSGTATGSGGRGAVLAGVAAQARFVPGSASTHPTSGQTGDLYVDSGARLWFCTVGGADTTWKQLQVV